MPARKRRCPEARVLASELDLELEDKRSPVPEELTRAFFSSNAAEQIAAAIELRKLIAKDFELERLRRLAAHLRDRYVIAAGPAAGRAYQKSVAPLEKADEAHLRAEVDSLLEQLKLIYTVNSDRDGQVERILRWSLCLIGAFFLALVVIAIGTPGNLVARALGSSAPGVLTSDWVIDDARWGMAFNYGVLVIVAAGGAVVSIVQRTGVVCSTSTVSVDPVKQLSALRHGLVGLLAAGTLGPSMALVLLAVFAGGMVHVPALTPSFDPCPGENQVGFFLLTKCVMPHGQDDAAKLLIWAFMAGFAERLVPDVLDHFMRAAKAEEESKTEPTPA